MFIKKYPSAQKRAGTVTPCGPGDHSPRHSNDWRHVNYVIRGKGRLMINGKEQVVNERDFAFVPVNIEHRFSKVSVHLNSLKGDGM